MTTQFLKFFFFIIFTVIAITRCSEDDDYSGPTAINNTAVAVPFFTVNEAGYLPTAADQLLYDARGNKAITAPDGHHLTWGEFSTVEGSAQVQCRENGARVTLELTGLIPNGVYTIWNVVFDAPGLDPNDPMLGADGIGAAGVGDGSDNAFIASETGGATITLTSPKGPLSMVSNTDLGVCPLADNFEWHVVGAYHIDNNTYGPLLGPDGTVVEQFGFIFKTEGN